MSVLRINEKESTKTPADEKASVIEDISTQPRPLPEDLHTLQRQLNNRQIQLIAIGGSIGTAIFVSIGSPLSTAGPGNLLLGYTSYCIVLALASNGLAEITTYMPVSGGFITLAGKWVDEAVGFMAGWNFFLYEALIVPFEITALHLVLSYWSDHVPVLAVCLVTTFLYGCLNVFAVRAYGESEFWLSTGKILLILIVFSFTFVTMVGGNPQHDAYGSRYWNNPGAFAEYRSTGSLGRFEAYLAVLFNASFTIVGPEYISMVAAEARHPRIYIKNAFKTIYLRFALFFIGSAFAVGIVVPYNSKELALVLSGSTDSGTAGASPYVIAMSNMGITVLPHIVNALLLTSIFSAGNTYFFAASRALYGLSLQGRAPKFLRTCTKQGIPIYCLVVVVLFSFLSLLQLSHGSAVVLGWLINLVTGAMLVSYVVMSVTYICFHRACRAQGFDRSKLPYIGWFQPYSAYIAMIAQGSIALCYGYTAFLPWDVGSFFIYYAMIILSVLLFIGWKLAKKTTWKHPMDVDLVWDDPKISAYELACTDTPTGFWREILEFVRVDGKLKRQA